MDLTDEIRGVYDTTRAALARDSEVLGGDPIPQTISGNGGLGGMLSGSGQVRRIRPDKNQTRLYREIYRHNPYVNAGIDLRAGEVVRPGPRITSDDEKLTEALETWSEQCTIYAGEYDQPLTPQLWNDARGFDMDGTVTLEHMYDDPAEPATFSGFQTVDSLTLDMLCYPNTSRLIRPGDSSGRVPKETPKNARGQWAAYVQNLGGGASEVQRRKAQSSQRTRDVASGNRSETGAGKPTEPDGTVPLSQDDVTKMVRNPMLDTPLTSGNSNRGSGKAGQTRGVSLIEPISSEAIRVQNRKDDHNAVLQNLAYPRVVVKFNQVELPTGDTLQWETNQMQAFIKTLRQRGTGRDGSESWRESRREESKEADSYGEDSSTDYSGTNTEAPEFNSPGGILGAPPGVEIEWYTPDLPDINPSIQMSINTIFSGMNVPKAYVGFGDDLNRDVTEPRVEQFDRDVRRIRSHISYSYTQIFRKKARYLLDRGVVAGPEPGSEAYDSLIESVEFAIESDDDVSPLQDSDFDAKKFLAYMQAWKVYVSSGVDAYLPPERLIEKDLGMETSELEEELENASEIFQNADGGLNMEETGAPQGGGTPVSDRVDGSQREDENQND